MYRLNGNFLRLGLPLVALSLSALTLTAHAQPLYSTTLTSDIFAYSPSGSLSTFATGFPTGNQYGGLAGIAVDNSSGDVFVADRTAQTIYKITSGGDRTAIGTCSTDVQGLTFYNGNLYVANGVGTGSGGAPLIITPRGSESPLGYGAGQQMTGVAFDSTGDIYIEDYRGGTVSEFNLAGSNTNTFAVAHPLGIAIDAKNNVFVASTSGNDIIEIQPNGSSSVFASGLDSPDALAINSSGNLFVGDLSDHIYEYTPEGNKSTFASLNYFPNFLAFGTSSAVPEPAFYQMGVLLPMGGLGLLRHLRKRAATDANANALRAIPGPASTVEPRRGA